MFKGLETRTKSDCVHITKREPKWLELSLAGRVLKDDIGKKDRLQKCSALKARRVSTAKFFPKAMRRHHKFFR
jgi:hypothetical protein